MIYNTCTQNHTIQLPSMPMDQTTRLITTHIMFDCKYNVSKLKTTSAEIGFTE